MPALARSLAAPCAALAACTAPADSGVPDDSQVPDAGIEAVEVLSVPDGPGDLELAPDGRVLIATRWGSDVLAWDPATDETDTVHHAVSGLQGVAWDPGYERLWAAVSDNIWGSLGWLDEGNYVAISSEAVDGTPIRLPEDVALAPDGSLVAVDSSMGNLLRADTSTGVATATPITVGNPRALCFHGGDLIVGGADGVYRVDPHGGAATLLDARPARGVLSWEGILLADNDDDGVFVVGGGRVGGTELLGPGPMLGRNGILYVSDIAGDWL